MEEKQLPEGYRIITNGTNYRIQKKWLAFWITQKYYSHGYDNFEPYEFNNEESAIEYAIFLVRDREKEKASRKWTAL